ncbi:MAG: hypothetical protein IJ181_10005 [Acidaminococcaceae bacterium]|nr:hypothetical protein [Acidaminococcaceae bacterium]
MADNTQKTQQQTTDPADLPLKEYLRQTGKDRPTEKEADAIANAVEQTSKEMLTSLIFEAMTEAEAAGVDPAAVKNIIVTALQKYRDFMQSDEVKQLREQFKDFNDWLTGTNAQRTFSDYLILGEMAEDWKAVIPYLIEELQELRQQPGFEEITMREFMQNYDPDTKAPIESHFERALRRAQEKKGSADAAAALLEVLPRLQNAATPKKHIMTTTRFADELGGLINIGEQNLPVKNEGHKNEITNFVKVTIEPQDGLTIKTEDYTEFERQVDEAVYSLYEFGDKSKVFTIPMVYRAMTFKKGDDPGKTMQQRIEQYIEKGRKTDVEIDATDEIRAYMKSRGMKDADKATFYRGDRLLPLAFARIKNGKEIIKGYQFTAEPPELAHAKATGKIMTLNSSLLDVKDNGGNSLPNTENRIAIKGYLLRRIQRMKRDAERKNPKITRIILFDSMMKQCGIDKADSKTEGKKYALSALDYWVNTGFIGGYRKREKKSGKNTTIEAVEIIFN